MLYAQKPDFVFRRNGRVHLNRSGRQFSRLLAAEMCTSSVVMLDTPCFEVVWRVLDTHSIRKFPLHCPTRASQCAITFQRESNLYPGCTVFIIVSMRMPGPCLLSRFACYLSAVVIASIRMSCWLGLLHGWVRFPHCMSAAVSDSVRMLCCLSLLHTGNGFLVVVRYDDVWHGAFCVPPLES